MFWHNLILGMALWFVNSLGFSDFFEPQLREKTLPANTNGNLSFQYLIKIGVDAIGECQGTLVYRSGDICGFASAAHCINGNQAVSDVLIYTADYGEFAGTALRPQEFIDHSVPPANMVYKDVSLIYFRSDLCKKKANVAIIPTYDRVLKDNVLGYVASKWFQGLHVARTVSQNFVKKINYLRGDTNDNFEKRFDISEMLISESGSGFPGIKPGDSGGGFFILEENFPKLAGVLSTSPQGRDFSKQSTYATNESITWLRKSIASLERLWGLNNPFDQVAKNMAAGALLPQIAAVRIAQSSRLGLENKKDFGDGTIAFSKPLLPIPAQLPKPPADAQSPNSPAETAKNQMLDFGESCHATSSFSSKPHPCANLKVGDSCGNYQPMLRSCTRAPACGSKDDTFGYCIHTLRSDQKSYHCYCPMRT